MKLVHYIAISLVTGDIVRSSEGFDVLPPGDVGAGRREWFQDWTTPADGPADARFAQAMSNKSWEHARASVEAMRQEWLRLKAGA